MDGYIGMFAWRIQPLREIEIFSKKTEYAAPTGLEIFGLWFYKDAAPTALGQPIVRAES
jgi:hypothetical protein